MRKTDLHVRTCLLSFLPREPRHVRVTPTNRASSWCDGAHMTAGRSLSGFRSTPSSLRKSDG
jgi:hypothetical protein